MDAYTKIIILQFCYIGLALSQFPPKYPVAPNPDDPCAKFNDIPPDRLPKNFLDAMNKAGCFNCGPCTGEYIKDEWLCDGKEDCSTGRDERYCKRENIFEKMSMVVSSPRCLANTIFCWRHDQCCSGYCKWHFLPIGGNCAQCAARFHY